ncbi:MAG: pyridoxamine 5'-phosphate oxidase family protein [Actinobacteria bacterium]|nr:pyridoxamine 5'-phosphate oxidase family protein [Actinomycetota bacterium]
MGKLYDAIDDRLADWIGRQRLFFVGTAPSGPDGHVNVSPKGGIESFRIVDATTVAYLDFVGSGVETISHLRDNRRIVVMFCAFEGPPRIVRLHGRGSVTQVGDPAFEDLLQRLDFGGIEAAADGARSVITIELSRIADSCGYGVPTMRYEGPRSQQLAWIQSRLRRDGPAGVLAYVEARNRESIDALPGIEADLLPDRG